MVSFEGLCAHNNFWNYFGLKRILKMALKFTSCPKKISKVIMGPQTYHRFFLEMPTSMRESLCHLVRLNVEGALHWSHIRFKEHSFIPKCQDSENQDKKFQEKNGKNISIFFTIIREFQKNQKWCMKMRKTSKLFQPI